MQKHMVQRRHLVTSVLSSKLPSELLDLFKTTRSLQNLWKKKKSYILKTFPGLIQYCIPSPQKFDPPGAKALSKSKKVDN